MILIHGITKELIETEGVEYKKAFNDFRNFIGEDMIVGFNINSELNLLCDAFETNLNNDYVDVLRMAHRFAPDQRQHQKYPSYPEAAVREAFLNAVAL
jgi:DNA polymerase III subunit epsilon